MENRSRRNSAGKANSLWKQNGTIPTELVPMINELTMSGKAIEKLITQTKTSPGSLWRIGAGTEGINRSFLLAMRGVYAVEPNDNMRMYGRKNTADTDVVW